MYGADHCWNGTINMHPRFPTSDDCSNDEIFLQSFDHDDGQRDYKAQRCYLPVGLAKCVADIMIKRHKVRRLHFVIVDL